MRTELLKGSLNMKTYIKRRPKTQPVSDLPLFSWRVVVLRPATPAGHFVAVDIASSGRRRPRCEPRRHRIGGGAMSSITIRMPSGTRLTFTGRDAWTLASPDRGRLRWCDHARPSGAEVVALHLQAPKAGLIISTDYEPHAGPFPGTHGRYRLKLRHRCCGGCMMNFHQPARR